MKSVVGNKIDWYFKGKEVDRQKGKDFSKDIREVTVAVKKDTRTIARCTESLKSQEDSRTIVRCTESLENQEDTRKVECTEVKTDWKEINRNINSEEQRAESS